MTEGLSREVEIDPRHAALLLIDVQNYTANRDGGVYRGLVPREIDKRYGYFFATLRESAIPNMQRLQKACRQGGIEILYTVIESLTRDGRDRGLDYKISGLHVPKGSPDAAVLAELAPAEDEIVIPKTSSSPFISTNIDYVLRNLGVHFLMIAGTDNPVGQPTDLQNSTRPSSRSWKLTAGGLALAGTAMICASFAIMNKAPNLPKRELSVVATEGPVSPQNEETLEPSSDARSVMQDSRQAALLQVGNLETQPDANTALANSSSLPAGGEAGVDAPHPASFGLEFGSTRIHAGGGEPGGRAGGLANGQIGRDIDCGSTVHPRFDRFGASG